MNSLHGCRLDFPEGLLPLRLFFLDARLPFFVLVERRMERFLVSDTSRFSEVMMALSLARHNPTVVQFSQ